MSRCNRVALSRKRRQILYENSLVLWRRSDAQSVDIPVPIECFHRVNQIGKGTYGAVDRAKAPSNIYVALKRLRLENERGAVGFPVTALREIKILSSLDHRNIVPLLDVVTSSKKENENQEVYLVFEYLDHDLAGLMNNPEVKFEEKHIKYYIKNLFEALYYLHEKCNVLHRDIKGSNILVSNNGDVKLGDFGLSRIYHKGEEHLHRYTTRVVTLWYRAPELLFGEVHYTSAIDVWAAACVFAELCLGKAIFPGQSDAEQIDRICKVVGSPSEENYPEALQNFSITTTKKYRRDLSRFYPLRDASPFAYDLLDKLLVLDPSKRLTAGQVLDHDYFHTDPLPYPASLDSILPSHDFETQQRRRALHDPLSVHNKPNYGHYSDAIKRRRHNYTNINTTKHHNYDPKFCHRNYKANETRFRNNNWYRNNALNKTQNNWTHKNFRYHQRKRGKNNYERRYQSGNYQNDRYKNE